MGNQHIRSHRESQGSLSLMRGVLVQPEIKERAPATQVLHKSLYFCEDGHIFRRSMPQPPFASLKITCYERKQLLCLRRHRMPQNVLLRVNIVLGAVHGTPKKAITRPISTNLTTVLLLRRSYELKRLARVAKTNHAQALLRQNSDDTGGESPGSSQSGICRQIGAEDNCFEF